MKRIGILGALPQEVAGLSAAMVEDAREVRAGRTFHHGTIDEREVVLAFSGWGKVAAATTATILLQHYAPDAIVFCGVAGAVDPAVEIGDVVVATALVQHDMDARPLFPRFEVPLAGTAAFEADEAWSTAAAHAAESWLADTLPKDAAIAALLPHPDRPRRVHRGLVASGDRFVADAAQARALVVDLPGLLCVEMEGAAVVQAARDHDVPTCVVRCISDHADGRADHDFARFLDVAAAAYAHGIVGRLLARR